MTDVQMFPDRTAETDEWLWLEDIVSKPSLDWVSAQNARSLATFDAETLERTRTSMLEVLDSTERIPQVTRKSDYLYNFWRDAEHPRGVWRRTTMESYRSAEPEWDVLLDIDALRREDDAEWVFAGVDLLFPDYTRALVRLSPDGGDAVAIREFDLEQRAFIVDGFTIPATKSSAFWIDQDTLLVTTDFGPGTLTTSSYPRQARRWRRGQPIAEAELLYEVPEDHVAVFAHHQHTEGFERSVLRDAKDFFHFRTVLVTDTGLVQIDAPEDVDVDFHREWILFRLRSDWTIGDRTWPAGSLLAGKVDDYLAGNRELTELFTPDAHSSLVSYSWTRHHLLLTVLRDVASRVDVLTPGDDDWTRSELGTTKPNQTIGAAGVDDDASDDYWLVVTGFLQPSTLQIGTVGGDSVETLKSDPSFFNEEVFTVEQHFATSDDGTKVPYFQISPKDLSMDGQAPTILQGYGGFEVPLLPQYGGAIGRVWLERGGVIVVANIRGGGEYGPAWHQAALRENRHRAYEDFASVARDLIARKVTSSEHLGCMGGSNGGLLVGNMLTQYPDLFGAIVCQVPLLDMKRYTQLSAGASWIAEYGDPGLPEDWAYIQTFSPYHNLREGVAYPPILFYTATSDDRVGPVQARKMAARMEDRGIPGVFFYENREGGHGGAADNAQRAHMQAMCIEFLRTRLFR